MNIFHICNPDWLNPSKVECLRDIINSTTLSINKIHLYIQNNYKGLNKLGIPIDIINIDGYHNLQGMLNLDMSFGNIVNGKGNILNCMLYIEIMQVQYMINMKDDTNHNDL